MQQYSLVQQYLAMEQCRESNQRGICIRNLIGNDAEVDSPGEGTNNAIIILKSIIWHAKVVQFSRKERNNTSNTKNTVTTTDNICEEV